MGDPDPASLWTTRKQRREQFQLWSSRQRCAEGYIICLSLFSMSLVVRVLIFLIPLLFIRTSAGFFHCMNLHDMTSGDKKSSFASQEFLHFHQTLLQKGKVGFRKRKKQTIKDIRFKCYQMWAKHWREVLKYLRLCLHVFSGSVSYDVTASAWDSLLQWLLEPNASFFISSLKHMHTLTKICIYICTHAHGETNTEWLSSAFYLLNQFQSFSTVPLPYLKCPRPPFPHFLFQCWGTDPLTKLGHLCCLLQVTLS